MFALLTSAGLKLETMYLLDPSGDESEELKFTLDSWVVTHDDRELIP